MDGFRRCEGLADVIWTIRQQAKHLDAQQQKLSNAPQNKDSRLQELLVGITELLSNIVSGSESAINFNQSISKFLID